MYANDSKNWHLLLRAWIILSIFLGLVNGKNKSLKLNVEFFFLRRQIDPDLKS